MRCLVANGSAAFFAAVDYYISPFCIGLGFNWAQNSAAGVLSVPGVYINVKRRKAERAVVARGVSERQNLLAAIFAGEAGVVFF